MSTSAAQAERRRAARGHPGAHGPGPLGIFFKGFLKRPTMVGSIIPSSPMLIDRMLAPVDWRRAKLFVEYGPGVGTFCRPILEKLAPDATLIVIDTNPDFIDFLKRDIRDPRFTPVEGSAADVRYSIDEQGCANAYYVLSGLPFATLPPEAGDVIAAATADALSPGGAFLVYQFSPKVKTFLEPCFARIDHAFEIRNIPPAQLYWAWKD